MELMISWSPTKSTVKSGFSRMASIAPLIFVNGPLSPPMQSSATLNGLPLSLLVLRVDDFFAAVVAAIGAKTVRLFGLLTLGAG
jgi:hypothetical protein